MADNIPLFLKFCDRDGSDIDHLKRFHALPFENKISIGVNSFNAKNHLCQPNMKDTKELSIY
ncbi:MAG: hypothetical protein CV087_18890 [Candidatus Brocadia sp. WS118]|nr:MAG: hypothetical protein CV087_18890 [Candidatus Brocadia sp. WS118]